MPLDGSSCTAHRPGSCVLEARAVAGLTTQLGAWRAAGPQSEPHPGGLGACPHRGSAEIRASTSMQHASRAVCATSWVPGAGGVEVQGATADCQMCRWLVVRTACALSSMVMLHHAAQLCPSLAHPDPAIASANVRTCSHLPGSVCTGPYVQHMSLNTDPPTQNFLQVL